MTPLKASLPIPGTAWLGVRSQVGGVPPTLSSSVCQPAVSGGNHPGSQMQGIPQWGLYSPCPSQELGQSPGHTLSLSGRSTEEGVGGDRGSPRCRLPHSAPEGAGGLELGGVLFPPPTLPA